MTSSQARPTGVTPDGDPGDAVKAPAGDVDRQVSAKLRPASSLAGARAKRRKALLSASLLSESLLSESLLPGSPADDPSAWGDRPGRERGDDPDSQTLACDYLAERPPHHDR